MPLWLNRELELCLENIKQEGVKMSKSVTYSCPKCGVVLLYQSFGSIWTEEQEKETRKMIKSYEKEDVVCNKCKWEGRYVDARRA